MAQLFSELSMVGPLSDRQEGFDGSTISDPLYLFDVPRCETVSLSIALSGRYVSSERVSGVEGG